MDIKQLVEDAKLRTKNDRRVWAVLVLAIVAIGLWSATASRKGKVKQTRGVEMDNPSSPVVGGSEGYEDLLKYITEEQGQTRATLQNQQSELEKIGKEHKALNEKVTGIIGEIVSRIEVLDEDIKRVEQNKTDPASDPNGTGSVSSDGSGGMGMAAAPEELEAFGGGDTIVPPAPLPPQLAKRTFISPGDAVQIQLLTGVAAPVDGTPYPVMFKLKGPVTGPDGSALDLGEARIVAAAQGSETDGRVVYRLTDLAFRNPDGRRSVVKVDGWVVGEDGIRGMRGKVIDKLGQVILATMAYSGVAAAGDAVARRYQNNFSTYNSFFGNGVSRRNDPAVSLGLTGNDVDLAAASALTDGSIRLTQLLLDKYEKLIPVVEVNSGRDVVAVFSRGAEVSIYDEEEDTGTRSASLD